MSSSPYILGKMLANERTVTPGYTPQFKLLGNWGLLKTGNIDLNARPATHTSYRLS